MLGELIGEFKGKITGNRVLPAESVPKMESSFQELGKILDIDVMDIGTFCTVFKEDGGLYGEGQGIMISDEDIVAWTGQALGKTRGMKNKIIDWRGSIFFNTTSEKFSLLNKIVGVIEFGVDEEGNTDCKIWEWK